MPDTRTHSVTVRSALIFEGLLVPVAVAGIALFGVDVTLSGTPVTQAVLLGGTGGILTFLLIYWLTDTQHFFRSAFRQHARDLHGFASHFSLSGIVCLSVLAGLSEELLFRALVQGWLAEYSSILIAVALAAILFGLAHFMSFAYFLVATAMGAVLGTAYVLSESILLVIVWHGLYDLVALIVLKRSPGLFNDGDDEY